jgi:hypothetical protein
LVESGTDPDIRREALASTSSDRVRVKVGLRVRSHWLVTLIPMIVLAVAERTFQNVLIAAQYTDPLY